MDAATAALKGLELAGRLDLPDDPLAELARQLAGGDSEPEGLDQALATFEAFSDRRPELAWVAYLLTGGPATRVTELPLAVTETDTTEEPIEAAPSRGSSASDLIRDLTRDLAEVHRLARAEAQSTMDLAVAAAGDRIGRTATSQVRSRTAREEYKKIDPWLVISEMGPERYAALNLNEQPLVRSAISEGVNIVQRNLESRAAEMVAMFGECFGVDFDPDPFAASIPEAINYLSSRSIDWLIARLKSPETSTPGEVAANPRTLPTGFIQCALEIAGGGSCLQSGSMNRQGVRPVSATGEVGNGATLTAGPIFVSMLNDTFAAYRPDATFRTAALARRVAVALRRENFDLGDALAEFEEIAFEFDGELIPLEVAQQWVLGAPANPFEPHVDLAGIWENEEALIEASRANSSAWPFVDNYHPGDHDTCQCDIETITALDLQAIDRRRSEAA